MTQHVHSFDAAPSLPEDELKNLLGGKGAGLCRMTSLGIPVPPGFTLSTEVCTHFMENEGAYPENLEAQVLEALGGIEAKLGRKFGDAKSPLLVSVRSGARVSMPGMMDTILNLGLNDETVLGLAEASGDRRFAFDAYRRLLSMYGDVVLGVDHHRFEEVLAGLKRELGNPAMLDSALSAEQLEELVQRYKQLLASEGKPFVQDPQEQLWGAIGAVFGSWNNTRAVRYRRMQGISSRWGTACTIQAMVFGNLGETSGSGVAFTRNPSTGAKMLYGEYLPNAQGEDVVAGIRTPLTLTASAALPGREELALERRQPEVFAEIAKHCQALEAQFGDMQDVEFTVENGRAFILQTRTGKRTARAAVRIAVEMVDEGVIAPNEALLLVEPKSLDQLLHARLPTPTELQEKGIGALAGGLPASPGAATGVVVFDADEAERLAADGRDVLLVRRETSPEDIHGMRAAKGIVTATGGMTSHAAVVARGLGKCCVAGVSAMSVDYAAQTLTVRDSDGSSRVYGKGSVLSLDGTHGKVYEGALDVVAAATIPEFERLMAWADEARRLRIRANADTPRQARTARAFGAEGIGLCRTEHMFFAEERLEAVRCMILAETDGERAEWLSKIEPMQRTDFENIFVAMSGLPVTVRLLDWPLHEFLPRQVGEMEAVARALGTPLAKVKAKAESLHEINPMLGHRAVRVGLTMPEIYRTQVRAVAEAAFAAKAAGHDPKPEIMIPVVALGAELNTIRKVVEDELAAAYERAGDRLEIPIGTMIELPRACLVADELARDAEFFSFGTNDLTQTTFGISRDDAGKFLGHYLDQELIAADPFARLDEKGVGALVKMAAEKGRSTRPEIHLGVCGEHGGDPDSIAFCEAIGLGYVSCSPPRLPIARLAAAQASLRRGESEN